MIAPAAIAETFHSLHGISPRLFQSPGRVNLIGEHTDYNEGFVLPMAIDRTTVVACAPREDGRVRTRSLTLERTVELETRHPAPASTLNRRTRSAATSGRDGSTGTPEHAEGSEGWGAYVEGVVSLLEERWGIAQGAEILLESDIPLGAGLSSSAALEVGLCLADLGLGTPPRPARARRAGSGGRAPLRGDPQRHHGPVHVPVRTRGHVSAPRLPQPL